MEPLNGLLFNPNDPNEFLWISERDGWRHVYLVSRPGGEMKLVTPGEWTPGLFRDEGSEKRRRAAEAIDRLRDRFGDDAVTRGRLLQEGEETTGTPNDRITE